MTRRVVIIGGGVIGLACAYYARQRGLSVTVIERNGPQRDGCSFGNAGMIVPSHFTPLAAPGMVSLGLRMMWNPESPFYIKPRLSGELLRWGMQFWKSATAAHVDRAGPVLRDLHLKSRECYGELADRFGNSFGLARNGLLMLCKTQHVLDDEARMAEKGRLLGIPAEILDARQTRDLDPGIDLEILGSVYFPLDCHLTPQTLVRGLQEHLEGEGVRFVWNSLVAGWRFEGSRLAAVRANDVEIEADEFVLSGGSWSQGIVKDLHLSLPIQAGKGYSLTLEHPRQLPKICSICTEARLAITPMGSTLRVGGTMEIAGLDESINAVRVRGIVKSFPAYYPAFQVEDFAGITPWVGLRPCSPDGLPYIGRTAKYDNLVIATGHAMLGLSLAPITGRIVGEVLSREAPSVDLEVLSPDRFA